MLALETLGMLGISLLFVGIVLVMNGVARFCSFDAKSTAFMNLVTGSIIIVGNLLLLSKAFEADSIINFQNVASGFLFGVTYIFIAGINLFKLDLRPFGWFSLFVAVYAGIMCYMAFDSGAWKFGLLWGAWAVLWLEGFLELSCKMKIGKIFPYLCIAEGIFAAFIPSILMLTDKW